MRAREYSVLFALALVWGISFYFIKIAVDEVSPATLVFGRLAFSVVTLAVMIAIRPKLIAGWRQFWRLGLLVGLVNIVAPYLLIAVGEQQIASGVASILNAATPLFTVLLANWWAGDRERLTWQRGIGILLGFLGVGVLIGPDALQLGGDNSARLWGELAVLLAALAYGLGALLSRRYKGASPLVGPMTMQTSALIVMLPVALLWSPPTRLPSWGTIGAMAELGILGTAVAYLLYFWLIRHVGATRTAIVTYLLPCTALIWGALLLKEPITWNSLVGLALVLLGTTGTNGTLGDLWHRLAASPATRPPVAVEAASATESVE